MKQGVEATYPITFRQTEAEMLGRYIKQRKSVVLIGMKRVGISNFLRFFLNHPKVADTYISSKQPQLFVQIDLNDLIEINLTAFWTLLLTRLVDGVQNSGISESDKRSCRRLFVQSIQLKDHFFTLDSVRKVLTVIEQSGVYPSLFFVRFDRLKEVYTQDFLSNLLGLRDAVGQKVSYIFTSHRSLTDLAPAVFKKQGMSVFCKDMYLPPAGRHDLDMIMHTLSQQYHIELNVDSAQSLRELSGGYVQYLQLGMIRFAEDPSHPVSADPLLSYFAKDEQLTFQSEELFESLTKKEKEIVLEIHEGNALRADDRASAAYLWNTGMVSDRGEMTGFFSPLFGSYVGTLSLAKTNGHEFTKKEHLLYTYLLSHVGELCERDAIVSAVWPEQHDMGVSDWAIDRLVARLRSKLKVTASKYTVVTVVTRGYKLVENS